MSKLIEKLLSINMGINTLNQTMTILQKDELENTSKTSLISKQGFSVNAFPKRVHRWGRGH